VTAILERPAAWPSAASVEKEVEMERESVQAQAQRITDLAYRVRVGDAKLIDVSHLSGKEALKLMLSRK
jgi:hypothetical protein